VRDLPGSSAAVERAVGLAGPDATVLEIHALAGGTHARTYLIRTANPEREFILREFPPGDDAPCNESRVLSGLGGLGGLASRLLASGGGGPSRAATFLDSYESASKSALSDLLFWDLWAVARSYEAVESWVPNYRDLGRVDLTARELRKRHTVWTQHLIRALS
jgi:hypothetical protein